MAFPTTSVLDNFNRAENPLSTGWAGPIVQGDGLLRIWDSTVVGNAGTGYAEAYRTDVDAADLEAYMTITTLGNAGHEPAVGVRVQNPGTGTACGYFLHHRNGTGLVLELIDGEDFTDLETWSGISAGDAIGLEIVDTTLSVYHKPAAGSWTLVDTVVDSTITGNGTIGIIGHGNVWEGDDFGGGEIVSAETPNCKVNVGGVATDAYLRVNAA